MTIQVFHMRAAKRHRVCARVTLGIRGNLKVWNRGRDGRFPSHANEAMEIDWMEVWTQTSVPVPYLGKQEEMVLDTLVCRCLSFCFPLRLPYRLQVGLQTL